MKRLIRVLGHVMGIHFAPDNHITPVLRLERFNRTEGPGYFWIIPFIERTLPSISTGIQVANFTFEEVLSRDNVPFRLRLTVLFAFDPTLPRKQVAAQFVRVSDNVLRSIVQDYNNEGLRRLVSRFDAEKLCGESAILSVERDLAGYLRAQMHALGLVPLRNGGVLIKETVAPEEFKAAMLNARRDTIRAKKLEAILQVLARYRVDNLIQQAIQAGFITGLEDLESNVTLVSSLSSQEAIRPSYIVDPQGIRAPGGHNGQQKH